MTGHPKVLMDNILPMHALSGCATVPSLYEIGKIKLAMNIIKHSELAVNLKSFKSPDSLFKTLSANGRIILASLYQTSGKQKDF